MGKHKIKPCVVCNKERTETHSIDHDGSVRNLNGCCSKVCLKINRKRYYKRVEPKSRRRPDVFVGVNKFCYICMAEKDCGSFYVAKRTPSGDPIYCGKCKECVLGQLDTKYKVKPKEGVTFVEITEIRRTVRPAYKMCRISVAGQLIETYSMSRKEKALLIKEGYYFIFKDLAEPE